MSRPARPWFRLYVEAVYDRKLRRLTPAQRWLWVAVLAAARQSCRPGVLLVADGDPMGVADLADVAAMPRRDVERGLQLLAAAGLVVCEEGCWVVPKWGERQYESDDVSARVRTFRERSKKRFNGVAGNVAVTVEETPPDTETETEQPPYPPSSSLDEFAPAIAERFPDKRSAIAAAQNVLRGGGR